MVGCDPGLVATADSRGHCCWPQQVWANTTQQCVGTPACPAGRHAERQDCVPDPEPIPPPPPQPLQPAPLVAAPMPVVEPPPAAPAAPPPFVPPPVVAPPFIPPPAAPPVAAPTAAAESTLSPTSEPTSQALASRGFHLERRFRSGMIASGAALLGVGYIIAAGTSFGANVYASEHPSNGCWKTVANTAYIPFAGPLMAVLGQVGQTFNGGRSCTSETEIFVPSLALAIVSTALQVVGITLLTLGFVLRSEELVPDEVEAAAEAPRLLLSLGAASTPVGVTLSLVNW